MPAMTAKASFWVGLTMRVTYRSQRDDEHAHRRQDRGAHDAVGLGVEHGRDGAEAESLAEGVEDAEQRRTRGWTAMMMPSKKAPKLASQNPPGMVTVVLA